MDRTWVECTNVFKEGVKQLQIGQLLHNDQFGLFEAMSAIEIMDPKMDSGMICNRNIRHQLSFQAALQSSLIKVNGFQKNEIIAIMDETLASFITWLDGYSLAQTVFLNLYVQQPNEIQDQLLKTFCYLIYNLIDVVREIANKASVYEEEDFQPSQFSFNLPEPQNYTDILNSLREHEDILISLIRKNGLSVNDAELSNINAIITRLRFFKILYKMLINFFLFPEKTSGTIVNDTKKLACVLGEIINDIFLTISFGSDFKLKSFEPLFDQRLLPPSFPKSIKLKSRREAYDFFRNLCLNIKIICKFNAQCDFNEYLTFYADYSKKTPCLLSRSLLQIMHLNKKLGLLDTIPTSNRDEYIYNFINPPLNIQLLSHDIQTINYVNNYLFRCYHVFLFVIQICGHNRARQRDKLARVIGDFNTIRKEGEAVDVFLQCASQRGELQRPFQQCFSIWILYYLLKAMIMFILSGFELELYSIHEYHYIFWYLYEYLFAWMISSTTRLNGVFLDNESLLDFKKCKKSKKRERRKFLFQQEIIYYQALQHLCGGYYKAIVELNQNGLLSRPESWFDNEKVRFEHRFQPFRSLQAPPPISYDEFLDMSSTTLEKPLKTNKTNYLLESMKHFCHARSHFESLIEQSVEIENLIKVAKTNFIVLKLIETGHKKENALVKFDFHLHKNFPVIKI